MSDTSTDASNGASTDTGIGANNDNRRDRSILAPVNRVSLLGWLAADPEVRVTGSGRWIVHLSLATDDVAGRTDGHRMTGTTTLNRVVVVDERLSRLAGTSLRRGQRLHVQGQLQTRSSASGADGPLIATEIVLSGRQARLAVLDRRAASSRGDEAFETLPGDA